MDFDPDAYLAKKEKPAASGFDPDAYLKSKEKTPSAPKKPAVSAPDWKSVAATSPLALPEAALSMGTGMLAKPVSDIAGLAATGKEMISPTPGGGDPEGFRRHVQDSLTYQPRTAAGQVTSRVIAAPGQLYAKGMHWLGDAARGDAAGNTARGAIGNAIEEGLNQAPGLLGAETAAASKASLPARQAAMDISKGESSLLDNIRDQSQAAGFKTPVEGESWMAGIPGIGKINKWKSATNEPKFNRAIAENFGLPKGTALSKDELSNVRAQAGKAYQAVTEAGYGPEVSIPSPPVASSVLDASGRPVMLERPPITRKSGFQTTPEFTQAINRQLEEVSAKLQSDPETFHALGPSARLLREQLKAEHDPKITMEKIRQLRKDASAEFKSDDPSRIASAFTRKEIANQLENMIESNLQKQGKTQLLDDFRKARTTIAQTYDVESALDNVGNVNARKLYLISQKRPLSGNLKIVADYAGAFPEGAQKVAKGRQAMSPWDFMFGAGSIASGHPGLALGEIAGRVGIPMLAQKGMLQKRTPSYRAGTPGIPIGYGMAAGGSLRPPSGDDQ